MMTDQASHNQIYHSIGALEQAMKDTDRRLGDLEKTVSEGFEKIHRALEVIQARESERKGSWRIIAGVAGVIGAVTAGLGEWVIGSMMK